MEAHHTHLENLEDRVALEVSKGSKTEVVVKTMHEVLERLGNFLQLKCK